MKKWKNLKKCLKREIRVYDDLISNAVINGNYIEAAINSNQLCAYEYILNDLMDDIKGES